MSGRSNRPSGRSTKLRLRAPVLVPRAPCRATTAQPILASSLSDEVRRDASDDIFAGYRVPTTGMASSSGSGGALMSKSKLSFKSAQKSWSPQLQEGGGGDDGGKNLSIGGGDGGDDGDDDDYDAGPNGEGDDGEEGRWWHKVPLSQLYDQVSVQAVLSEWFMTIESLPGFLRLVAQMQYYSTAQWVRYLTMQERPNVFRTVERTLSRFPDARSGFVGRMLADPAFMQKTALEGAGTFAVAAAHEVHVRGRRIKDEADLALISASGVALSAAMCYALIAPSKTPTPPNTVFPWQRMLNALPNNAFEKSTPARSFAVPQRVSAFFAKGLELSAVYAATAAVTATLQHCVVAARRTRDPKAVPVTPLPGISRSALGMGVFGALFANTRLQACAGLDRTLLEYAKANTMVQVIGLSMLFRTVTQIAAENPFGWGPRPVTALSRPGLEGTPVQHVRTPMRRRRKKGSKRKQAPVASSQEQIGDLWQGANGMPAPA